MRRDQLPTVSRGTVGFPTLVRLHFHKLAQCQTRAPLAWRSVESLKNRSAIISRLEQRHVLLYFFQYPVDCQIIRPMLTVRFIRHGESLANAGGVTAEPHSVPLTQRGHVQAEAISRSLVKAPDLIISSPYLRARDTAAPTALRFPHTPFEIWPVQEFASLATSRRMHTTAEERRPWIEAIFDQSDPQQGDGEDAESYADFIARVRMILDRLSILKPQSVVVFSHGQFMKAVHWEIAEAHPPVSRETMQAFRAFHLAAPIENAAGFAAVWDGLAWRIAVDDASPTEATLSF